jgi:mRNA interferase MazF
VFYRGEIWWADLPDAVGSGPGYTRPVLIIQSDEFNRSSIQTVVVVALTTNLRLASAPGNVFLPRTSTGLPKDSVAIISQLMSIDKTGLRDRLRKLRQREWLHVEAGLRLILDLR